MSHPFPISPSPVEVNGTTLPFRADRRVRPAANSSTTLTLHAGANERRQPVFNPIRTLGTLAHSSSDPRQMQLRLCRAG